MRRIFRHSRKEKAMTDLERIAKALWFAGYFASQGNYTPPKIGDLVFELTADESIPFIDRVGILKQEQDGIKNGVIEALDGKDVRWTNYLFKTIPESFEYRNLLDKNHDTKIA